MADAVQDTGVDPVGTLIRQSLDVLSSGERKVGRAILANYPIAGLVRSQNSRSAQASARPRWCAS